MTPLEYTADQLDRWRAFHRLTIPELAEKAGVSVNQCRNVLGRGDILKATLSTLVKVADTLGVDVIFSANVLPRPATAQLGEPAEETP